MNSVSPEVGIDISMAELVSSVDQGKPFRCANTVEGAEQLADLLPEGSIVHIESSGGYERTVESVLLRRGFEVRMHNPYHARRIAQGRGRKAKTDPIDAKLLSENGHLLPTSAVKSTERKGLTDFSRAIDCIKETIAQYKKRIKMPEFDADAKAAYQHLIDELEDQAKKLELKFKQRIQASSCKSAYELALSVPTVGPVAARSFICELPENLPSATTKQMSSYSGMAPQDESSGKRIGPSRVGKGNGRIKKAAYMCALTAIGREPWARDLYSRLKAKGRTHEQAMVAVMRRILVRVVTVLQRGSPWQGEPQRT